MSSCIHETKGRICDACKCLGCQGSGRVSAGNVPERDCALCGGAGHRPNNTDGDLKRFCVRCSNLEFQNVNLRARLSIAQGLEIGTHEEELVMIVRELGPNARDVLLVIARRLHVGRELGDFDDARNWTREAQQEALDGMAYLARLLTAVGGA